MNSDEIKKVIQELLERMHVKVDEISATETDGKEQFSVRTEDSSLLIGGRGTHLFALNHLIRKIAAKGSAPEKDISVDVNDYQKTAVENLKNIAKIMGERARSFKSSVELDPMSSYDRMIIHEFFQDAKDLKTESIGEGERRRVVIKYVEPAE